MVKRMCHAINDSSDYIDRPKQEKLFLKGSNKTPQNQ